jgi:hypothetical protein
MTFSRAVNGQQPENWKTGKSPWAQAGYRRRTGADLHPRIRISRGLPDEPANNPRRVDFPLPERPSQDELPGCRSTSNDCPSRDTTPVIFDAPQPLDSLRIVSAALNG